MYEELIYMGYIPEERKGKYILELQTLRHGNKPEKGG
jgi:hypothetical protein